MPAISSTSSRWVSTAHREGVSHAERHAVQNGGEAESGSGWQQVQPPKITMNRMIVDEHVEIAPIKITMAMMPTCRPPSQDLSQYPLTLPRRHQHTRGPAKPAPP